MKAYLHYEMEIRGKPGDSVPHLKFFKQKYWKNIVVVFSNARKKVMNFQNWLIRN